MNEPNRKLELTIIGIVSLGFVFWSIGFIYRSSFIAIDGKRYFSLFDDAMISMRYAWNFSHGQGLVYNTGQYIQGYTNLLMVLLMSLATWAFDKSTADLVIQISGIGFMLVIAYTCMQISDHFVQNETFNRQVLIRVLSFICALSYYPLLYWSLMGMETGLLTMLLLLGILFALNYTQNKKPALLLLVAVFLGLAYLTRNDSIVFSLIIWFYIAWDIFESKTERRSISILVPAISIFLLTIVGQAIFQYFYYGEWLPNTYTLKLTGVPLSFRIRDGIGFVTPFLVETGTVLLLTTFDLILNFRIQKLLLFSMVFVAITYQIFVGGDPWNYWRLMSPSIPLLLILFIITISTIVDVAIKKAPLRNYFLRLPVRLRSYADKSLIIVFILLGLISINSRFWPQISLRENFQVENSKKNVNTAIVLNRLTTRDATFSLILAGTIPYFTDRTVFDMLGKTDRYIAHLPPDLSGSVSWYGMKSVPGHNKYDLNYSIIILQPTYVQTFQWGNQDLTKWAETRYVTVKCSGVKVALLKKSPTVIWSRIKKGLINYCI